MDNLTNKKKRISMCYCLEKKNCFLCFYLFCFFIITSHNLPTTTSPPPPTHTHKMTYLRQPILKVTGQRLGSTTNFPVPSSKRQPYLQCMTSSETCSDTAILETMIISFCSSTGHTPLHRAEEIITNKKINSIYLLMLLP